jgi:LPXTG-motif cell wall-anchored protein
MRKNLRIVATTVLSVMLAVTMGHSTFAATEPAEWTEPTTAIADAEIQITGDKIAETDAFKAYQVIKEGNGKYVLNTDLITSDVINQINEYVKQTPENQEVTKANEEYKANNSDATEDELQSYAGLYDADSLLAALTALAPESDDVITDANTTGQDVEEQTDVVNYLAKALYNVYETPATDLTDDQESMLALNREEITKDSENATVESGKVVYKPGKKGTYLIIGDGSDNGTIYLNMLASVMQDGKQNGQNQYKGSKIVAKASQANGSKSITNKTNANGESNQRTENSDYVKAATISGYTDKGVPSTATEEKTTTSEDGGESTTTTVYKDTYTPDSKDKEVDSQSNTIGDTINFTLSADVPCYPSDATDKTFYMGDVLGADGGYAGLTYVGNIEVKGTIGSVDTALKEGTDYKVVYFSDYSGKTVISSLTDASAVKAFAIVYDYDKIKGYDTVTATYDTILNENAVIASVGNPNSFKLVYSTNPYHKESYEPGKDDSDGNSNPLYPTAKASWSTKDQSYKETSDMSVIYTYSLAVEKIETRPADADDSYVDVVLQGAKFNVYANKAEDDTLSKLVGTITTDEKGYGVLVGLAQAATYYLQEIEAPDGYSLDSTIHDVALNADNFDSKVTTTTTTTTTKTETVEGTISYTGDEKEALRTNGIALEAKNKDGEQLYFKATGRDSENAVIYSNAVADLVTDATTTLDGESEAVNNLKAYVSNQTETVYQNGVELTSTYTKVDEAKSTDIDVTGYRAVIPNTKLGALPATGGMGTYIFTIVGVCIMVCAAGLYFVNRKRRNA